LTEILIHFIRRTCEKPHELADLHTDLILHCYFCYPSCKGYLGSHSWASDHSSCQPSP